MSKRTRQRAIAHKKQQISISRKKLGFDPDHGFIDPQLDVHMINDDTMRSGTKGAHARAIARLELEEEALKAWQQLQELRQKLKAVGVSIPEEEISQLHAALTKSHEIRDNLTQQIEELKKHQEGMAAAGHVLQNMLKQKHSEELARLQAELNANSLTIKKLQQRLEEIKKTNILLEETNKEIFDEISARHENLESLYHELQENNTVLMDEKEQLIANNAELIGKNEQLEQSLAELNSNIKSSNVELENIKENYGKAMNEKEQIDKSLAKARATIESLKITQDKLSDEVAASTKDNTTLTVEKDQLQIQLSHVTQQRDDAQQAHAEALNTIQQLALQADDQLMAQQIANKELTAENIRQQQQIAELRAILVQHQQMLVISEQNAATAEKTAAESQTKVTEILAEKAELKVLYELSQGLLEDQTSINKDLLQELENTNKVNAELTRKLANEQATNEDLQQEIEEIEDENTALTQELEDEQAIREAVRIELEKERRANITLRTANDRLCQQLQAQQNINSELRQQVKEINVDHQNTQHQLTAADKENASLLTSFLDLMPNASKSTTTPSSEPTLGNVNQAEADPFLDDFVDLGTPGNPDTKVNHDAKSNQTSAKHASFFIHCSQVPSPETLKKSASNSQSYNPGTPTPGKPFGQ
jgi:chromosome segregation ATPase